MTQLEEWHSERLPLTTPCILLACHQPERKRTVYRGVRFASHQIHPMIAVRTYGRFRIQLFYLMVNFFPTVLLS